MHESSSRDHAFMAGGRIMGERVRGEGIRGGAGGGNGERCEGWFRGNDFEGGTDPDDSIDGVNIALLKRMGVCGGDLDVENDGGGGEEEGSEPRGSFALLSVIFIEHMAEIFIGFYRHQGIEIFRAKLILEDQIPIK